MSESKGIAYCQGRYMPIEEASIPILDPAFHKSDVVFDAVTVCDGVFFRLDDHMQRFHDSCAHVRLTAPLPDAEIRRIMAQCVHRAGFGDAIVYVLCTRGRYAGGAAFGDPRSSENELIAYAVPYYTIVPEPKVKSGAHLWIAGTRRAPDAAINQRCKNFNRMDLTAAHFEALDAGADQPVLLSTDGYLTEGPGFNVWIVRDGKALTPGENLLEGITRKTVFDLCQDIGIEAEATDLVAEDLEQANEAFISSSGGGVMPVVRVNDKPIGNGAPGITTGRLSDLYWSNAPMAGTGHRSPTCWRAKRSRRPAPGRRPFAHGSRPTAEERWRRRSGGPRSRPIASPSQTDSLWRVAHQASAPRRSSEAGVTEKSSPQPTTRPVSTPASASAPHSATATLS